MIISTGRRRALVALAVCWLPASVSAAEDGRAGALSGTALVDALRQGGFVIYFRHADTGPAYPEPGSVDLARCETQRNLNDAGRAQARDIGEQFRRLRIPVAEVLTSEFCRCWQTAELAFGRYRKEPALTGVSRDASAADRRDASAQALRRLLGTSPVAGTNSVLVSHGYNLYDAEGFHLGQQGEAAVFRPAAEGYKLIARIGPGQWARLRATGE